MASSESPGITETGSPNARTRFSKSGDRVDLVEAEHPVSVIVHDQHRDRKVLLLDRG
jgi:hypothetical protein